MPSIKVLKQNGELVEEFELTEKVNGSWVGVDAMTKACEADGDIIQLPIEGCLLTTSINLGTKQIHCDSTGPLITCTNEIFDIKTARKSLLSRAIKGSDNHPETIEREGHLYTFGESTIEVDYVGSKDDFPFKRIKGNE